MPGPNFTGLDKGFEATTAVRQFRWVFQTANEKVREATTIGERCIGVCQEESSADDATNGRVVNVRMQGISRCIAGDATPTRGTRVTTDAQGRCIASGVGNVPLGRVVSAPGTPAAGDHIDVELTPGLPVT